MTIQIKNWKTSDVIYTGEHESVGEAVEAAVRKRVCLSYADLPGANLHGCDLTDVVFEFAHLNGAGLSRTNLTRARLCGADLGFANLKCTILHRAQMAATPPPAFAVRLNGADLSPAEGTFDPHFSLGTPPPDPDLMRRVMQAVLQPGALNMRRWHTCDTRHCLAGWAIHLAGPAGYVLESITSPSVAGSLLIPEAAHLFYHDNSSEVLDWCRNWLDSHQEPEQ